MLIGVSSGATAFLRLGDLHRRLFPEGSLNRRARVDLPDELPTLLIMFVVWLTLLQWKRESSAAG